VIVSATEGAAPASQDVVAAGRTRKTLNPEEVIAAYDVTFSFLRKNIERSMVNRTLNEIFAKRFGKDLVLMAFNGDTSIGSPSSRLQKALAIIDGYVERAESDADVHDYAIPSSPSYSTGVFPGMLQSLPKDYRDQREMLCYFVSADVYDAYAEELGSRATALGDDVLAGPWNRRLTYMGIDLCPVYGLDTGKIILTPKMNLAVGFGQTLEVGRDIENRERLMKVTMTAQVDANYAVSDAVVLGSV